MSDSLFLVLLLGVPLAAGCFAWSHKWRVTACVLWLLAVWLAVGTYMTTTHGAKDSARKNACIANLRQMVGAVQQWAQEHQKQVTNTYMFSDPVLLAFLKGSTLPTCPGGGHYSPGATVADAPKCSLAAKGHTL